MGMTSKKLNKTQLSMFVLAVVAAVDHFAKSGLLDPNTTITVLTATNLASTLLKPLLTESRQGIASSQESDE